MVRREPQIPEAGDREQPHGGIMADRAEAEEVALYWFVTPEELRQPEGQLHLLVDIPIMLLLPLEAQPLQLRS